MAGFLYALFLLNRGTKIAAHLSKQLLEMTFSIDWALVVPWITRENILFMFLAYRNVTPQRHLFFGYCITKNHSNEL
jgi:hypothetical protein